MTRVSWTLGDTLFIAILSFLGAIVFRVGQDWAGCAGTACAVQAGVVYQTLGIALCLAIPALRNRRAGRHWGADLVRDTDPPSAGPRVYLAMVGLGVGLFITLQFGVGLPLGALLEANGLMDTPPQQAINDSLALQGVWGVVAMVSTAGLAPLFEELLYRGVLTPALAGHVEASRAGKWVVIVAQALIFAGAHGSFLVGVVTFLLGLVLGWLRLRYRVVWPCVVIHGVFNGLGVMVTSL